MALIDEMKAKVLNGELLSAEEAVALAEENKIEELCRAANEIRKYYCGDSADLCSIINARSGRCSEDCKWCSQSVHHKCDIDIYELISSSDAVELAKYNEERGVNRFSLVTSGKQLNEQQLSDCCSIYSDLQLETNLKLCASMGLLSKDQLQQLKDFGVSNYHCNIETAPSFFPELCTTHTIDEKVQRIKWAQEVGMEVCSGGILGMGESMAQRIEMAIFLRELKVKSIPINVLKAIDGTVMERIAPMSYQDVLMSLALFRFINPDSVIRFAAGRDQLGNDQFKAFEAGVNAVLTGDLLTTSGSSIKRDKEEFIKAGFQL